MLNKTSFDYIINDIYNIILPRMKLIEDNFGELTSDYYDWEYETVENILYSAVTKNNYFLVTWDMVSIVLEILHSERMTNNCEDTLIYNELHERLNGLTFYPHINV